MNNNQETVQHKKKTGQQFETDKRICIERRQFTYSFYIPERRSGKDRRKHLDINIDLE